MCIRDRYNGVADTLAHCYMKRGHLCSFLHSRYNQSLSDFKEARTVINKMGNKLQIQMLTLVLDGYESGIIIFLLVLSLFNSLNLNYVLQTLIFNFNVKLNYFDKSNI